MIRAVIPLTIAALYAVFGTSLLSYVKWQPSSELDWAFVGFSSLLYGFALWQLAFSRPSSLRRRFGLSELRLFQLSAALRLLGGTLGTTGAVMWLTKADTVERVILGIVLVLAALIWIFTGGFFLWATWGTDGEGS